MSENEYDDIDWSGVETDTARTILEQAETYLKAQLDISMASDRRALTVGSIFVSVAIGIGGSALSHFTEHNGLPLFWAGLGTAALLLIGAWLCFWSARPIPFHSPGSHPKQWWPLRKAPLAEVIGGETENYQRYIQDNELRLRKNAKILQGGSLIAVSAPVVGLIVWLVSLSLFP